MKRQAIRSSLSKASTISSRKRAKLQLALTCVSTKGSKKCKRKSVDAHLQSETVSRRCCFSLFSIATSFSRRLCWRQLHSRRSSARVRKTSALRLHRTASSANPSRFPHAAALSRLHFPKLRLSFATAIFALLKTSRQKRKKCLPSQRLQLKLLDANKQAEEGRKKRMNNDDGNNIRNSTRKKKIFNNYYDINKQTKIPNQFQSFYFSSAKR